MWGDFIKYTDYREERQHGSPDFTFQYYFLDKLDPQYVMPLHWHREMEVVRVLTGRLTLFVNNEAFVLNAGDCAIIPSGALHRADPENSIYDCAVFDISMIASRKSGRARELAQYLISSSREIYPLCREADKTISELLDIAAKQEEFFEFKVIALLSQIAYLIFTENLSKGAHHESQANARRRAIMTLLIDKIEKEYTNRLTLADLAAQAQINEKYLCRFFKEYTGQTPIDYINRLRIDRACYEISIGGLNVTEAAFESGFNELSYFSKVFKRYKGVSPGEYRKRYGVMGEMIKKEKK